MVTEYIFFYLEIALKDKTDSNIYAFENVSHIPTNKLVDIFNIDLLKDPYIIEGYSLTKSNYRKHKTYLRKEIGSLNLDKFEYCLRQYTGNTDTLRKLYKKTLFE
jgi:hypothetical protein